MPVRQTGRPGGGRSNLDGGMRTTSNVSGGSNINDARDDRRSSGIYLT